MSALESLDPSFVGDRLRIARETSGLTQKDAADSLGIARTTLVAIEQGVRRAKVSEIQALAKIYGSSVNALMREEAVHIDLVPRFRKLREVEEEAISQAVKLLADLAKAEVELENLLGIRRPKNFPPERPILPGDVKSQAETDAQELRERLGIGSAPISDIVSLLEMEVGVRVYIRKIDPRISGMYVFDDVVGPCILLNAVHPKSRRAQSGAHEFGHFISTRRQPEVYLNDESFKSREERYADSFARAFLAPERAVKQKFLDITAGSDRLTRRHIIVLANFFSISREALVRRLEELGLVKRGAWDWFESNGKITDAQAKEVLGDLAALESGPENPATIRLNVLAEQVYRSGLLSEGQLSRLLQIDRAELREMLVGMEDADGFQNTPKLIL